MSPQAAWTPAEEELLASWEKRATAAQHAHYFLATRLRRRNLWLGIPVTVFAAIVGTSLFATLANPDNRYPIGFRVLIATISLAAAVLAAIQTFLRFAERAERHAQAADWYSSIRRKIDELLALPPGERGAPKATLDELRTGLNKAGQTYPEIGEKIWHRVASTYGVKEPSFLKEAGAPPVRRVS